MVYSVCVFFLPVEDHDFVTFTFFPDTIGMLPILNSFDLLTESNLNFTRFRWWSKISC